MYDKRKPTKISNDLLYAEKSMIAGLASFVGTVVSNGFSVRAVNQIGDLGRKEMYHRAHEKSSWFKGFGINAMRIALLNSLLIWPYNAANEMLYIVFGDVYTNRILATGFAAFIGTAATLPLDHIRARLQYQSTNSSINRMNYLSASDCFAKMMKHEGYMTFTAGFTASFMQMFVYTLSTIYLCDIWIENERRK